MITEQVCYSLVDTRDTIARHMAEATHVSRFIGLPVLDARDGRRVATDTGIVTVRRCSVTSAVTFDFEPVPTELTLDELLPLMNKPVEDRFWAIETTQKKRRAQWKQDPLLRLRNKPRGRA